MVMNGHSIVVMSVVRPAMPIDQAQPDQPVTGSCRPRVGMDADEQANYRGSPVPVTGTAAAQRLTGLRGLGVVARKREPL
jgi:hypothetical protein